MKFRSVANILPAQAMQMGPITIHQPLPTQKVEQIDPFLLLHHFGPWTVEPGHDPLDLGPHPHRGFEPVTFLYNGGLRHRDSRNNTGILEGGDVQWMTAGMGIIHSERSNKTFLENGGTLEGIQLWVNLGPEHKFVQPRYQDMKEESFPRHDFGNGAVLKVVAGEFQGQKGPTKTYSPIIAWQLELPAGATVELPVPEDHNFAAYLLDGEVSTSNGFKYEGRALLNYKADGEGVSLTGVAEKTRVLLLGGVPLEAPVVQHGPFVMNNQTEIMEAMRDYQMGKMGVYIEE
jgi:redox-sensitive bicupin YhaK (pirin superfamily)